MRSPARCLCSLLLFATTCWAGDPPLTPKVDFGWLKANPMNNGWLLTYVFASESTSGGLHTGDLLISVDDQTLEGLAPLSAAHVMQGLATAETAIVYRNGAPVRLNFVSLDQRVIRVPLRRRNSMTQTFNSDVAGLSITLPDLTGLSHNLPFPPDGKWTLLHIWAIHCPGLDALNEMANPEPPDLHVVGIETGNRIQDVRSHMASQGLRFFTLVAEDLQSFSRTYDPSIKDVLLDPEGRIVFMGAGGDSLRNAYLLYRSQSTLQTARK